MTTKHTRTWQDDGRGSARAEGAPPHCPACQTKLDGLSTTSEADTNTQPDPGCVSVCLACTSILQFDEELQLELMPRTRWCDVFGDDERREIERMSVLLARTVPVKSPFTLVAWHGDAWYALSIWPNHDNSEANLVVRSPPYEHREPLDALRPRGQHILVVAHIGLDPLIMRWGYRVMLESLTFGWRRQLERSGQVYPSQAAAQAASVQAVTRLRDRHGFGGQVRVHDPLDPGSLS